MQVTTFNRSPCAISWCPVPSQKGDKMTNHALLALGKRQSMDDAFESHSELEIVKTVAYDKSPSLGKVISTSSFNCIDWGQQSRHPDSLPLGLIAGLFYLINILLYVNESRFIYNF